jgi:hypothetical protein
VGANGFCRAVWQARQKPVAPVTVFFAVVGTAPGEVSSADVLAFITVQRKLAEWPCVA